ncbi:MAG: MoxR family ATPase [Chloroflexi bacterium]|nr:MoxR family ATPase [Chloroflexota bacterium]
MAEEGGDLNAENDLTQIPQKVLEQLSGIVIGKDDVKRILIVTLIAGGHVLIEGLPGTAKTKIARSLARIIGCDFKRIQFTPDMMPADVTGFYLYSPNNDHRFMEGPIFASVVLADELNRTTSRTQAALLEAMQERQVTVEGTTYALPKPFIVIGTQVATGAEGTYPLADVQIDRFMLRASTDYATVEEEIQILSNIDYLDEPDIETVTSGEDIIKLQQQAKEVYVSTENVAYIVSLVNSLRRDPDVLSGPSIRGGIAIFKCSRALALLEGRDFVIPDDIKELVKPALQHRIKIKVEAEMDGVSPADVLERVVQQVPVPKIEA